MGSMSPRIAVGQMNSTPSMEHNLRQVTDIIAQARLSGARFVCLPECADYIVDDPSHAVSLATPLHGSPLLSRYHALASQSGLWLSIGGFHELSPHDSSRLFNTHVIISPENVSTPVATYRKMHLFDAQLSNRLVSEHVNTIPGDRLVMAYDTPIGNVGLSTCYDVRFPSLYEALRHAGAHVMLVPSAFFPTTGAAHWHTLLRARAIENQCYVAAAAQAGRHTGNRESYGHALLVGPFGEVIADAGADGMSVISGDVEVSRLEEVRQNMPVLKHRRSDVLGRVASISRA